MYTCYFYFCGILEFHCLWLTSKSYSVYVMKFINWRTIWPEIARTWKIFTTNWIAKGIVQKILRAIRVCQQLRKQERSSSYSKIVISATIRALKELCCIRAPSKVQYSFDNIAKYYVDGLIILVLNKLWFFFPNISFAISNFARNLSLSNMKDY